MPPCDYDILYNFREKKCFWPPHTRPIKKYERRRKTGHLPCVETWDLYDIDDFINPGETSLRSICKISDSEGQFVPIF
ncbi:unnamed protein product [Trichogramma brassicae]|uniref:Uncharacterized protein n=1 Tax=Trichogramma brassicae TaxID=86971 RepID=A0A6H5IXC5_9HYME|nr:unnamed protein product [Trichogramma brassicae]